MKSIFAVFGQCALIYLIATSAQGAPQTSPRPEPRPDGLAMEANAGDHAKNCSATIGWEFVC